MGAPIVKVLLNTCWLFLSDGTAVLLIVRSQSGEGWDYCRAENIPLIPCDPSLIRVMRLKINVFYVAWKHTLGWILELHPTNNGTFCQCTSRKILQSLWQSCEMWSVGKSQHWYMLEGPSEVQRLFPLRGTDTASQMGTMYLNSGLLLHKPFPARKLSLWNVCGIFWGIGKRLLFFC